MAEAAKLVKVPDNLNRGIDALPKDENGKRIHVPASGGKTVTQTRTK
jgi:hypothetical protein